MLVRVETKDTSQHFASILIQISYFERTTIEISKINYLVLFFKGK